jgi:serine kinase of HPr protein (carbohydrate metabolism regulator)
MSGAESETIHASCIALSERAILLTGPSGSGKSDLALRLLDRGAILVSDDYTILTADRGVLVASAPATIAGRIEVRGVGLVEIGHESGFPVSLVVDLAAPPERMPSGASRTIAGIAVPVVAIAPFEASAPIKVELALLHIGLEP